MGHKRREGGKEGREGGISRGMGRAKIAVGMRQYRAGVRRDNDQVNILTACLPGAM